MEGAACHDSPTVLDFAEGRAPGVGTLHFSEQLTFGPHSARWKMGFGLFAGRRGRVGEGSL